MPLHTTAGRRIGLAPSSAARGGGRYALSEMVSGKSGGADEDDTAGDCDSWSSGESTACDWESQEIHPAPTKITLSVAPVQCEHSLPDAYRTGTYKFEWHHTNASKVFVVGSFNNWGAGVEMETVDDGKRHIACMDLPFGWYHYKFIVDGNWWYDIMRPTVKDAAGNVNNVLRI